MFLSTILRRLLTEKNPSCAEDLCQKLENAVHAQSNQTYICSSFEHLLKNMISILKECPKESLDHASRILGIMGYINRSNFPVYQNYLTEAYHTSKEIHIYIMLALKTTLSYDALNCDLLVYSERLLIILKDYLENAESPHDFIAISSTIAEFSKNYKNAFEKHFTDIVDIIVGWHLETEQPQSLKLHCSNILQQFSEYFLNEMEFAFRLLGQFLEDIVVFGKESYNEYYSKKNRNSYVIKIASFIGAFTSVFKVLVSSTTLTNMPDGLSLINNMFLVLRKTAENILFNGIPDEELILNVNDLLCVIVTHCCHECNLIYVEEIIQSQVKELQNLTEMQITSLLLLIYYTVRELRTNIPESIIKSVYQSNHGIFASTKLAKNKCTRTLLLAIYRQILMIKNVPLLQDVYRHITGDIDTCIETLENYIYMKSSKVRESQLKLSFYFSALSVLAIQTSSIIGMYALSPSILELLIINCKAAGTLFWRNYPSLHSALLKLIIIHCKRNRNFIPTSRLFSEHLFLKCDPDEKCSPTSENLSMIFKFLSHILTHSNEIRSQNLDLLLDWISVLFEGCKQHACILEMNKDFVNVCKSTCDAAILSPIKCGVCIRTMLKFPKISEEIFIKIRTTAILMVINPDSHIEHEYGLIYASLPLEIGLSYLDKTYLDVYNEEKVNNMHDWYKSCPQFVKLRSKYFKYFLDTLDLQPASIENFDKHYSEIFLKCWTHASLDKSVEYEKNILQNSSMLLTWLQFEGARYCINSKLRTTIGKPQDTFLFIEAIIMKFVRIFAKKGSSEMNVTLDDAISIQKKIRNLLGFIENLEKHIYNATEGTAFALLLPEKPSKTFFRINDQTCREWFKRIRTGVILIAIHSKHPEVAIYNSEEILRLNDTSSFALDQVITFLVWALVCCEEADTLHGIYNWLKVKTGKRYSWIQYVVEQISGRKEKAITGYMSILKENKTLLEPQIKEFLINQLLECMFYTGQYSEMEKYMSENIFEEIDTHNLYNARNKMCFEALDMIYKDYAVCEDNNKKTLIEKFSNWKSCSKENICFSNLSYFNILRNIENTCLNQTLGVEVTELTQSFQLGLLKSLKEVFFYGITRSGRNEADDLIILNHAVQKIIDDSIGNYVFNDYTYGKMLQSSSSLEKCFLWKQILKEKSSQNVEIRKESSFLLTMAIKARCEENYKFCNMVLLKFFKLKGFKEPLKILRENILSENYDININDSELLMGLNEMIKCVYTSASNTSTQMDAINLGSAYCLQIIKNLKKCSRSTYPSVCSEMLLTLADWLSQKNNPHIKYLQINRLLTELPEMAVCIQNKDNDILISDSDRAVGRLLYASTVKKSDYGDAWYAFGNWCYRWGKKYIETRNAKNYAHKKDITLKDLQSIEKILGENINEEEFEEIFHILNNHEILENGGEEDIETDSTSFCDSIESELRNIKIFKNKSSQQIENVIKIWRTAHKNIYDYYEIAARSYFKYLSIDFLNQQLQKNCQFESNSTYVTTTLRILRLIVKHAIGLQEVLEEGLKNTPLHPWKIIIPQLFSRLNHHETYVRKSVSDLLYRLAQDTPHLVIFPTVVGANQENPQQYNCLSTEEDVTQNRSAPINNCYSSLLHTLKDLDPETVLHVQLLVKELKRITLLWEEYWMQVLSQICGEYSFLFSSLENEYKRHGYSCSEIIKSKYDILMKHIVSDLDRAFNFTKENAETNYEKQFQERFNDLIKSTIGKLKLQFSNLKYNEGWIKVKELHNILHQRTVRGSISTLKTCDLSPVLANMRDTSIAMPGIDTFAKNPIYIKAVDCTIYILPTKTKPKKLSFFGSNGKKYTYLFKGLEDLHLDERIMQFLAISNTMMARSNDPLLKTNTFKAHHYSVIPLGTQSGLISWVEGVTPLFAIYKKWQHRETAFKLKQKPRSEIDSTNENDQPMSIPNANRPSEIFFQKLSPILAEYDVKITDSRKLWPLIALRRVLEELMYETPNYLISKEIWCNAINAALWRKSIRSYSVSVAVMSVIGYIIGLGDRHLDNILIKLSSGDIVHIDYNVCFEKGKTLRVPEKVPFRLTPNLEVALGITRTEGIFRLSCEHVLRTLRKEKETLLTLLEAFVYDPLVDWTINDECQIGLTRITSSAQAAASSINALYASCEVNESIKLKKNDLPQKKYDWKFDRQFIEEKYNEVKPKWFEYKEKLESTLKDVRYQYRNLIRTHDTLNLYEEENDLLEKEIIVFRKLFMDNTGTESKCLKKQSDQVTKTELNSQTNIEKYYAHWGKMLKFYMTNVLVNPNCSWLYDVKLQLLKIKENSCGSEFEGLKVFLQSNNKQDLVEENNNIQREIEAHLKNELPQLLDCLNLLLDYANVMYYFPRSFLSINRMIRLEKICSEILFNQIEFEILPYELNNLTKNNVEKYCEAMGSIWKELQSDFQLLNTNFNKQKRPELKIENAANTVNDYNNMSKENENVLKYNMLVILNSVNDQFLNYEEQHEKNLLDHQINYISMVLYIYKMIFYTNTLDTILQYLLELSSVLISLQELKSKWELRFIQEIFCLNVLDDNMMLQLSLDNFFESSSWYKDFISVHQSKYSDILVNLVSEIIEAFNEFENKLNRLHQVTLHILKILPDSALKEYIISTGVTKNKLSAENELKFETIANVFQIVRNYVRSLKENNFNNVYDIRVVISPLLHYVDQLQTKFLCGLTPLYVQLIYDKLHSTYEINLDIVDESRLCLAKTHSKNFIEALQYNGLSKVHQIELKRSAQLVDHYRFVASAYFWMNEYFLFNKYNMYEHIINKRELLLAISNAACTLSSKKNSFLQITSKIERCVANIHKCFEEISLVSNIQVLRNEFTENNNSRKQQLDLYMNIKSNFLKRSEIILQCENFAEESKLEVINFLQFLNDWKEHSLCYQHIKTNNVNQNTKYRCIKGILEWLEHQNSSLKEKLCCMKEQQQNICYCLSGLAQNLQDFNDNPVRLEIRFLLKTIIKQERYTGKFKNEKKDYITHIRELQDKVKNIFVKLYELHMKIAVPDYRIVSKKDLDNDIHYILKLMEDVNTALIDADERFLKNYANICTGSKSIIAQNCSEKKSVMNGSEQKRNAHAVSVWKKIRAKLEGRDPDSNYRSTVNEQVEFIISEATNIDNLAVLYEGWTPWV